ncbi:protein kinase-like domain-containing protein [Artemisia annua]|uniref:Protein kinase-like domain-containing protein n=1 Tax=Artemisia annua TaxID=35608 RepID=A0A2U1PF98_ARTAN|nr:protein kinase-like domain-containing protein [Artemisia annua]
MEWQRGPVIGRGSSATVYLATDVTGHSFAVKSTGLLTSASLQKEQHILSQLSSPNIISYMGYDHEHVKNVPMFNLFMEYAPYGSISDIIKKHGGSLEESLIQSYINQILIGLNHVHLNNIVHCDIKCDNILVCENGVKIGDFGCAKWVENRGKNRGSSVSSVFSGTPAFMAPEVARGEEQGFEADVWAVGCVLIQMATGFNPWVDMGDPVSVLYKIGFSGDIPEFPKWLSPECKDFLDKCLKRDVKERWSVNELLRHPFVDNLSSGSKKVEECMKCSPTSVLDQDFWGCLEVSQTSPALTQNADVSDKSPVERIRGLVKDSPLCLPNWDEEEDWITVRSNDNEESLVICSSLDCDTDLTCIGSTSSESRLFSDFYVDRTMALNSLLLEDLVVNASNQCVKAEFRSTFLDLEKIFDDNYLLLGLSYVSMVFVLIGICLLFMNPYLSISSQI